MTENNMRKRMCIYVRLGHFAVQQKFTEHCKSTIKKKTKKKICDPPLANESCSHHLLLCNKQPKA